MEFGHDNCTKIVLKKGKLAYLQNLIPNINREIEDEEEGNCTVWHNQHVYASNKTELTFPIILSR
jgi:hypothetical protein